MQKYIGETRQLGTCSDLIAKAVSAPDSYEALARLFKT